MRTPEWLLSIFCMGAALIISNSTYAKDSPAILLIETERVNFVSTISPHRVIIRHARKLWRYYRKHRTRSACRVMSARVVELLTEYMPARFQ
jgi:hypothetical protein